MKYFLILLFALLIHTPDPEYPGCINGIGHTKHKVLYTIQDTTGLTYHFDTTFESRRNPVDGLNYTDTLEWVVTPAGMDTIYWVCPRCDSLQVEISDETTFFIRRMEEIK